MKPASAEIQQTSMRMKDQHTTQQDANQIQMLVDDSKGRGIQTHPFESGLALRHCMVQVVLIRRVEGNSNHAASDCYKRSKGVV